jgi:chromosome segregation protein
MWDALMSDLSDARQTVSVEQARIEQLREQLREVEQRREKVRHDRSLVAAEHAEPALRAVDLEAERESEALAALQAAVRTLDEGLSAAREQERAIGDALEQARSRMQALQGRRASLEAVQQAALGRAQGGVSDWLARCGLGERPRLAQELSVAPGWESAVETVLGAYLEAVCVDGVDEALGQLLASLDGGTLTLLDTRAVPPSSEPVSGFLPRLASKVAQGGIIASLFPGVYAAESLHDALGRRPDLRAGESIITREGIWIGASWLRVTRDQDLHAGVLAREQELRAARELEEGQLREVRLLEQRHADARAALDAAEQQRVRQQHALNDAHARYVDVKSRREGLSARGAYLSRQLGLLDVDEGELARQIERVASAIAVADARRADARQRVSALDAERTRAEREREHLREGYEAARTKADDDRAVMSDLVLQIERYRSALAALTAGMERLEAQRRQHHARRDELDAQLAAAEDPLAEQKAKLHELLAKRLEVEAALAAARRSLEESDATLRQLEQSRASHEQQVEAARGSFDAVRIVVEQLRTRRMTYEEQVAATGFDLSEALSALTDDATLEDWEAKLKHMESRIERLGPINLAAIEEYQAQLERKQYLDAQHSDLSEALATLEQAIRRIDRETRTRFQETFERVDAGLKRIFPRLFGGGHAYLELTGEDVLSAGVGVMARPPGKRNSTIHLLSGGEKALTAVALIFAIFELNPAPFCMLDEVDAPLDDANVERFCDIVRDMSDRVQFVVITHNKRTIELATHLTGVTMQEAGVSRLVAVDVEEAVRLAAT